VDEKGRSRGSEYGTFNFAALGVADLHALTREHRRVAILEIGDRVGEGSERDRIGAEIHFSVTVTDRKRGTLARAYDEVVLAREQKGERERTSEPRQRRRHRLGGRVAVLHLVRHQMGDNLGVGIGAELRASLFQLVAKLAKILDDAVVDHGEALGRMRVRVVFGRSAVGRPAGVADADRAGERLPREPGFEIAQLALRLPSPARRRSWRPSSVATPAESYPRYSSRLSASTSKPATGSRPRMPTIPHMRAAISSGDGADYSPALNVSAVKATREIKLSLNFWPLNLTLGWGPITLPAVSFPTTCARATA